VVGKAGDCQRRPPEAEGQPFESAGAPPFPEVILSSEKSPPKRISPDRTSVLLTTHSTEPGAGGRDETASASAEPGGMEFL
jgi:hypothetical protein